MNDRIASLDDYHRIRSSFRWPRPECFNFGTDVVDRWARTHPDSHALYWSFGSELRTVTFSEIAARSNQVAGMFHEIGLKRGDRVLVILPRVVEWWELFVGLIKAGLVGIPGTTVLTARDIAYRIESADVKAVVTDEEGAAKVDQVADEFPHLKRRVLVSERERAGWNSYESGVAAASTDFSAAETRSGDPSLMFFTSGTTGPPKMVLHNQVSYGIGHEVTGRFWLDLQPGDLHWNISDTGWAKAAWSSLFGPWICGASLFVRHTIDRFNASDVFAMLSEFPITTFCAAPTVYRLLVQANLQSFQPQMLRRCVAAGEPLNPAIIQSWKDATGLTICDGYGQSETVLLCGNFPGCQVKPGSMGLPSPGIELAVIDSDTNRLPAGKTGDLAVRIEPERPVGLFDQYWRLPDANTRTVRGDWYLTGDCAYVDDEGYFWYVSRADDVITSSAYRIGPFEVESALLEHPAVVEVGVVGKPDAIRGEIVKAFVVLATGYEPSEELKDELQQHTKQTTAPYKYPREIEFLAELPKTTSGKIRRNELRDRTNAETR